MKENYQKIFRVVHNGVRTHGNKPACSQGENMTNLLRGEWGKWDEMARAGTGKETDGCPGNGWLTAADLCPPLPVWKSLQILMLSAGLAVPYLDARLFIIRTFENQQDVYDVRYHISNSIPSLSYPVAPKHPPGWIFYRWILPIYLHWHLCELSSAWHFSHRPGSPPKWTFWY